MTAFLDQSRVAVFDTKNLPPMVRDGGFGDSTDDRIETRAISAPGQDPDLLDLFRIHGIIEATLVLRRYSDRRYNSKEKSVPFSDYILCSVPVSPQAEYRQLES